MVDSVYELPIGFSLTPASNSDCPELLPLTEQLQVEHPELHAGIEERTADKGDDSIANNRDLLDDHEIKPVIDKRTLWKDADKTRPLYPDRVDSFVYDEDGRLYCLCPATAEQRELTFGGFESERGTLKYRCPAAACGLSCAGRAECQRRAPLGVGDYGRVVRGPLELDRRIFTPIARTTAKWDKTDNRR
ncbi:MAG: transposase, partial [bacterium]|nr:transposase [bacterium]